MSFESVTELQQRSVGVFTTEISPDWTIGGRPNGGYLLAMLGRAAGLAGPHPHVLAASAHYLAAPQPGPATVEVEVSRAGRSASQLRASLLQDGRCCVQALLTTGGLAADSTAYWNRGVPRPGTVPMADCPRIPGRTPTGLPVAIMDQVDLRIEPGCLGFADGRPSGRGELHGWLALPDGADFDPCSLLFAVDAFPPATFEIEATGWVPTLELTAYVRALPAPGPVRILQRAQLIEAQRVDEACFIWDVTGRLVAQGSQLAGIQLG
ncbi:MAG TPA: thioesterase family protein [Jatrophihabitans sp.]|nr:thioesterase family protein [Jatrophihabitans sp.]